MQNGLEIVSIGLDEVELMKDSRRYVWRVGEKQD
jgi:hypothetical protein